jgi:hypothetical protein
MTASGQTMLRYAAGMVTFISCSALLTCAQQAGQVAYFEKVHIKPGEVEKYEATLNVTGPGMRSKARLGVTSCG